MREITSAADMGEEKQRMEVYVKLNSVQLCLVPRDINFLRALCKS